jgi:glutamyl-tRNA(Gln) amidotransferase subunit D
MKNILVVFTGGTIGSTACDGVINTTQQAGFKLIQQFQALPQSEPIQFDCIQPLQLLSENLHPSVWTALIQAIEAQPLENYDGIIVSHGTDTLAFTAAALSFYFHALAKPLLLVSSNYPLEHPQANGLQNFSCAVEFIRQQKQNGVFVPYTNPNQITQVHIGTRLAASLQLSGDFISVQSKSYLTFQQGEFTYVDAKIDLPGFKNLEGLNLKANFSKRILLIKPYPGLDYANFNLNKVDAVLHDLYHSGTACTTSAWGENHTLLAFIQRCKNNNIPCYLAPALKTPDVYASSCELQNQGATILWNISLEAAYVKLLLAYGNFAELDNISAFMQTDIALEHL